MKQTKWFNRKFDFSAGGEIFPSIIERLTATPSRLEEKCRSIPSAMLTVRVDSAWTILENIGHLSDLEPLWQGRLDDILNGEVELRPTDLQNTATSQANHNAVPLEDLLHRFRQLRKKTIDQLHQLSEEQILLSALHPRLKTPMRAVDLFLFVAEHDDHHLVSITDLIKRLQSHQ